MLRKSLRPRPDWRAIAEKNGFFFHHVNNSLYWDESACYIFSLAEIENDLEGPANELHAMCMDFVAEAARDEAILIRLAIPEPFWDAIANSLSAPAMYGRMDFSYSGSGPAALLEYNADTPTSLYEAAYFQWLWLEDMLARGELKVGSDQFNSIQEHLRDYFRRRGYKSLHLASIRGSEEDRATVEYIMDCALQEGIDCTQLYMDDLGLRADGAFVGLEDEEIGNLFKLYPWEFVWTDEFGLPLIKSNVNVIEPAWKMLLSNKGILPLLWQKYPGHPNLLPAWFEGEAPLAADYVVKPMLGREGANIAIYSGGQAVFCAEGIYGAGKKVCQAFKPLPAFEGNFPVMGVWVTNGEACGLGIREDTSLITGDLSRFVPHYIDE